MSYMSRSLDKVGFVLGISYAVFMMITIMQYQLFRCPNCGVSFFGRNYFLRTCRGCDIPINKDITNRIVSDNQSLVEDAVERPRHDWLVRHWKSVLAVWVGLAISPVLWLPIIIRCSDATKASINMADSNPALTEKLGRPIKTGWLISGYTEVQFGTGQANLEIPVSGPNGSGIVYADVRKLAGVWRVQSLAFGLKGSSDKLDLLTGQNTNGNSRGNR
jgi:hypothetical protein